MAMIREIACESELGESAGVVRESFATVAAEFGLTQANCPTHPAYTAAGRLRELREKGARLFGLFEGDSQIGFVAIEKASESVYYVERLAVLPKQRHSGHGRRLMEFACDWVRSAGGETVSIGIINANRVLKDWYASLGFGETCTKSFAHLPFDVCFMERAVGPLILRSSANRGRTARRASP